MIRLRIKEVLEREGWTMAKLSRRADLAYKTVQDICADPYRDTNLSTLGRIQEALGVSIHDLVEDAPETPEKQP